MEAIFKYNGGYGAMLCSKCLVIMKIGEQFTKEEHLASIGQIKIPSRYCDKCAELKECKVCKVHKPIKDFPTDREAKDGTSGTCKHCKNAKDRKKRKEQKNDPFKHF